MIPGSNSSGRIWPHGMRRIRVHAAMKAARTVAAGKPMLDDAAKIMLEAWYWMPYGLLVDLCAYHFLVRWLDVRG